MARTPLAAARFAEALPGLKSRLMTAQECGHRLRLGAGKLRFGDDQLPLTAAYPNTVLIRRDDFARSASMRLIDGMS